MLLLTDIVTPLVVKVKQTRTLLDQIEWFISQHQDLIHVLVEELEVLSELNVSETTLDFYPARGGNSLAKELSEHFGLIFTRQPDSTSPGIYQWVSIVEPYQLPIRVMSNELIDFSGSTIEFVS